MNPNIKTEILHSGPTDLLYTCQYKLSNIYILMANS